MKHYPYTNNNGIIIKIKANSQEKADEIFKEMIKDVESVKVEESFKI